MTPDVTPAEPRVTLDDLKHQANDLKHRAEIVKSRAVTEAKATVNEIVDPQQKRTLMIAAGVVLAVASIAYFMGTRAGRAAMVDRFSPE